MTRGLAGAFSAAVVADAVVIDVAVVGVFIDAVIDVAKNIDGGEDDNRFCCC